MGWISEIPDSEAQGPLRQTYDAVKAQRGKVARVLGAHSLDPGGLQHHLDLYMHLMFSAGPMSRREREAIAVTVSAANGCAYCVAHHLEALRCYEKDEGMLATVRDAPDRLAAPRLRAMLLYARRLTISPSTMDEEQVGALRAEGLRRRGNTAHQPGHRLFQFRQLDRVGFGRRSRRARGCRLRQMRASPAAGVRTPDAPRGAPFPDRHAPP